MRMTFTVVFAALTVAMAVPAFAELQNVEVGGSIRIRANYISPEAAALTFVTQGNSLSFIEQRTRLNVRADFTNDVSAFIELDSYDIYGEDFRDTVATGANLRSSTGIAGTPAGGLDGDVEVYQAYIETRETWGYPVTFRIGRQEIQLGSEWLVGNNDTAALFTGLSFDGITVRYDHEDFNITGIFAKLAELSPAEEDGDTDLWAIYASYTGIEDITIDAYWIFVDIGLGPGSSAGGPALATGRVPRTIGSLGLDIINDIEGFFGVDQFDDTTTLHTVGLRGAGTRSNFDFEVEVAYQFGDATLIGAMFPNVATVLPFTFFDDDVDFDAFGANLEVGWTFDVETQPRIYFGMAFFEGDDDQEDTLGDFLASLLPFAESRANVGFNRLFSDWEYGEFIDPSLSNVLIFRGGISLQPTESVELSFHALYFLADEETHTNGFLLGLPLFNEESDDELGWEVATYLTYHYSEDLTLEFGYSHFFAGDGMEDGNAVGANGLGILGGPNVILRPFGFPRKADDDADYVYFETSLSF